MIERPRPLTFAFFGSSLVSAYWNGAATYYRGIIRALHALGHRITFYEPDAYERQQHRDLGNVPWCRSVVYSGTDPHAALRALDEGREADVLVKASGIGVFDELLQAAVPRAKRPGAVSVFWDVDAPATLERMRGDVREPLHEAIPRYDLVLTYGGGDPVVNAYQALGARRAVPVYNALDADTHFPAPFEARYAADLALLANRLPDREARIDEFFFRPARALRWGRFLLGGNGWHDKPLPENVSSVGHVYTKDHNAFNSTPLAVLNVARDSMAQVGYSPATRIFEAAGAGACIITDAWEGIELFLEPATEILVARDGAEVASLLESLTPERARVIGQAARRRILAHHTYTERARQVEALLAG